MKKATALFAALLLLPLCASAETIAQQLHAPEHVSDAFASSTGRTAITIDAAVDVPDAEEMYLIPVASVPFDDEMVGQVFAQMWPDVKLPGLEIEDENQTYVVEGKGAFKGFTKHSAFMSSRAGGEYRDVLSSYGKMPGAEGFYGVALMTEWRIDDAVLYDSYITDREAPADGIPGHALTPAQAIEKANAFIRALTDEPFICFGIGETDGIYYDDDRISAASKHDQGPSYVLTYTRVVEGAPLLPAYYQLMLNGYREDLYIPAVGYEQMFVTFDRDGQISDFTWLCPAQLSEERTPQTLLTFPEIMTIAEKMLPLRYQSLEAQGEQHYRVTRISLGYMALLQRDELSFALTPVWSFYGDYDPEQEHYSYRPLLTLNAVDGTVVDLDYGY